MTILIIVLIDRTMYFGSMKGIDVVNHSKTPFFQPRKLQLRSDFEMFSHCERIATGFARVDG